LGFSAKWVLTFLNKHHHEVNATRDFMASHMANRNVSHMVSQKTSTVVEVFCMGNFNIDWCSIFELVRTHFAAAGGEMRSD